MESILETIHDTPLLKLHDKVLPAQGANIYSKIEYFNPCGSIKDRICLNMVDAAIAEGKIDLKDTHHPATVIEATSGNTGLGLAMVCAAKGIRLIIVMPKNYSIERRYLLKELGAELILTSAEGEMPEAIKKAEEVLSQTANSFMPRQFSNPHNPEIHSKETAQEIIRDMGGRQIDAFVVGVGTGGSFSGIGRVLKEKYPKILLIAVEPAKNAVISGEKPGIHQIQGIGAGFIPENLDKSLIDEVIKVDDSDALNAVKLLASNLGVLVGISSGANFWAASQLSARMGLGKNIVTLFPDKGERYFSLK